ncbi:hypothetical protein N7533_012428 [Penicillium manginii]|uniref:uncharacterized protein n=1 Tax=Penicillium manginii TaxID=203109 RepID=UPI002547E135|nr:uncharacterized protein N7533_012428 [Penicillium manginii]KAJ5739644.1 hypothetical protein N7533_012428 [Penicillium manginii]
MIPTIVVNDYDAIPATVVKDYGNFNSPIPVQDTPYPGVHSIIALGYPFEEEEDGKELIFEALSDKCIDELRQVSDFYDNKEAIEMGLYEEFEK